MGRLRLLVLAAAVAGLVSGCALTGTGGGGSSDADLYRHEVTPPLSRIDGSARDAMSAIASFEHGDIAFAEADQQVIAASKKIGLAQHDLVALSPPDAYIAAHRGLLRSTTLLRAAFSTYDLYLHDYASALVAFQQTRHAEGQAARATKAYAEYVRRFGNFQVVARATMQAAPEAFQIPDDLLSYTPPETAVYQTDHGVFAGPPA